MRMRIAAYTLALALLLMVPVIFLFHPSSSSIVVAANTETIEKDDYSEDFMDGYYYYEEDSFEEVEDAEQQEKYEVVVVETTAGSEQISLSEADFAQSPTPEPVSEIEPTKKPAKFRMIDSLVSTVTSQVSQNTRRSTTVSDL